MKLVDTNSNTIAPKIIANATLITFEKYKTAISIAPKMRKMLSVEPIFFLIEIFVLLEQLL